MIYFIRHGQTDYNMKFIIQGQGINVSLNDVGRKSAELARENLKDVKLDRIISSPLLRARETAEIINKDFGLDVFIDDRLIEICVGIREGTKWDDWTDEEDEAFWNNPEKFGAETPEKIFERVRSFYDEYKDQPENILVVSHAGVYKYFYRIIHNISDIRKDIKAPKNAEVVVLE